MNTASLRSRRGKPAALHTGEGGTAHPQLRKETGGHRGFTASRSSFFRNPFLAGIRSQGLVHRNSSTGIHLQRFTHRHSPRAFTHCHLPIAIRLRGFSGFLCPQTKTAVGVRIPTTVSRVASSCPSVSLQESGQPSGAKESRTPGLNIANVALCQLSYRPDFNTPESRNAPKLNVPHSIPTLPHLSRGGKLPFPEI